MNRNHSRRHQFFQFLHPGFVARSAKMNLSSITSGPLRFSSGKNFPASRHAPSGHPAWPPAPGLRHDFRTSGSRRRPDVRSARQAMALTAPRNLKAPVRWRFSHLQKSLHPIASSRSRVIEYRRYSAPVSLSVRGQGGCPRFRVNPVRHTLLHFWGLRGVGCTYNNAPDKGITMKNGTPER